jgi:membrane-bound ClpP family serine protease
VVGGFGDLRDIYHLEGSPQFVEPGWADTLIDTLGSPQVAWILLLIGGAAVYLEAKTPGIGLGGLIGALCFLVFFWARFLGGTAEWLEVLLFLAGIGLLLVEIFVLPGFGIFGLMGGLCVITSVILASQTFYIPRNDYQLGQFRDSMVSVAAAGIGIVAAIGMLRRFLPHTPMFNQVMLEPPRGTELEHIASNEVLASFSHLLGMHGATTTPLTPAGKARFGDQVVDVVSDGEFIERGTEVVVVQARANRVVVKPV